MSNSSCSEAQARGGEEPEIDPEQFKDLDNEVGLFAGTTYEADDEEADQIYDQVDKNMGTWTLGGVLEGVWLWSVDSLCPRTL